MSFVTTRRELIDLAQPMSRRAHEGSCVKWTILQVFVDANACAWPSSTDRWQILYCTGPHTRLCKEEAEPPSATVVIRPRVWLCAVLAEPPSAIVANYLVWVFQACEVSRSLKRDSDSSQVGFQGQSDCHAPDNGSVPADLGRSSGSVSAIGHSSVVCHVFRSPSSLSWSSSIMSWLPLFVCYCCISNSNL